MKLDELILVLKKIEDKYGNIDVVCRKKNNLLDHVNNMVRIEVHKFKTGNGPNSPEYLVPYNPNIPRSSIEDHLIPVLLIDSIDAKK